MRLPMSVSKRTRAATSALIDALEGGRPTLLCASDCVDAMPGSDGELGLGHGAAALAAGLAKDMAADPTALTAHGAARGTGHEAYHLAADTGLALLLAQNAQDALRIVADAANEPGGVAFVIAFDRGQPREDPVSGTECGI